MDIPSIYQYYPTVPLSDLSDLYSAGENTLNNERACIVSYLPKTLRLNEDFAFNNVYVLFIENTTEVTSITWEYKLYKKGEFINDTSFLHTYGENTNEYSVYFLNSLFETTGEFKFDRLKIICTVVKGSGQPLIMSVEHTFAKMVNVQHTGLISGTQSLPFTGEPATTNYLLNHLADYFVNQPITWKNEMVEADLSGENTLLKIALGVVYHNLLTSGNQLEEPHFYYNISEYENEDIRTFINEQHDYEGSFTNGLCKLPLHILNDVLEGGNSIPDFIDINPENKVYKMIEYDPGGIFNTIEDDFLITIPQKLADSKDRLIVNKGRFTELYHLSLFPKSAIKLTAILIKYLFECSKKNECRECKNKFPTWPFLHIDSLKQNQDFLKNILTHYFNSPANNIHDFATDAVQTASHVWVPALYTIINAKPRIVKAYFAKRVVKHINLRASSGTLASEYIFDFERIDSSMVRVDANAVRLPTQPDHDNLLGRELYIVVETLHCRGKELVLNVRPSNTDMTGDTADLELLQDTSFVRDLHATVGDPAALQNNNSVLPGTEAGKTAQYFSIDHSDKAIFKVSLRPAERVRFDIWATTLGTRTALLELKVRRTDNATVFLGNDVINLANEGNFLSPGDRYDNTAQFRVVNHIVYESFDVNTLFKHRQNASNVLVNRLGTIENNFVESIFDGAADADFRKVSFFYHDLIGNEYLVAEYPMYKPTARGNGVIQPALPATAVLSPFQPVPGPGVDAQQTFIIPATNVIYTSGTFPGRPFMSYAPLAGNATIVYMTPINVTFTSYEAAGDTVAAVPVHINYRFHHTSRFYAHPGCFAAFVGAMAEANLPLVESTGMCFRDATSYPSFEHPNGDSIDVRYQGTSNVPLRPNDAKISQALKNWHFTDVVRGNAKTWIPVPTHAHRIDPHGGHNDHLHAGNFDLNQVLVINQY